MKGILFKPWKIKAIADSPLDRLWQTRRTIKGLNQEPDTWVLAQGVVASDGSRRFWHKSFAGNFDGDSLWQKPLYQVGEVVYLRETLFRHPYLNEAGYVLDNSPVFINQTIGDMLKWRWQKDILSAMFMPQEAARYFIQITDVRVERLQSITEEDAIAEGTETCSKQWDACFVDGYIRLWDSINKPPYDWNANPYVFVYSFKRTEE